MSAIFVLFFKYFFKESPWPQPMSESSELYIDRGWDRVGEGCIRYRFDCLGQGLPTLQPQTIRYTLPPRRLVYRGAPLPTAVVRLDLPQHSPGGKGRPQNLHQGSWPRGSNQGPPE